MLVDIKVFHSFNMSDNIKFMCVCGRRHWEWQGQLHGRDHGGWWHHDVSLQLECCSLRAGCGELCLCWVHLSVEHFQDVITSRFMTWHIRWRRSRRRRRTPARRSRRPMILTEVIMMSRNSMVSSSWLPLPSTRSLTTKPHDLNVFRHVESIKKLWCQPPSPQHITS